MKNITSFLLLVTFTTVCLAQERNEHEAHTHGLAEMTVVYENQQLILELETPAANMLGFEHEPRTEEEIAAVQRASKFANAPLALFDINPRCEVAKVDVDFPYEHVIHSHEHDDDEDLHHHEDHHHDHDSEDHDPDHDHEHNPHKDVTLAYEWHCDDSSTPTIQLRIFDLFSDFESIQSQWIVNGKQGFSQLDKNSTELDFDE